MKTNKRNRVLICGDSITKGITFDETRRRYTKVANPVANEVAKKMKFDVDNVSKFGNTVKKAINSFKKAISENKYKFVVFELGGNDCDFNWKAVANDPEGEHAPNTDYTEYKQTLKELIQTARDNHIIPILATLPPIDAHKYFNWVCGFSEDAKPKVLNWLGNINRIYWWQEKYNAGVLQVAKETDCEVLDLRTAMLETDDYRNYYCIDGIHPTAEGHEIMTNAIVSTIEHIDFTTIH